MWKNIFGGSDGSPSDAAISDDSKAFAQSFVSSQVYILSLPIPDAVDPAAMTQEQLLDLIRKAAKESAGAARITPFTYKDGDVRVFPIFTSQDAAKEFIKQYATKINRIVPFQISGLQGRVLLPQFKARASFVLNAMSKDERRFSERDLEELSKG